MPEIAPDITFIPPEEEITKRFLSPDPVVQAPENTQNYNRYSYALNNPLKYTDPSGMSYAPHPDDERLYVNDMMAVYHRRNSGNMNLHAYNQWMYDMMDANSQWQYMGQQRFDNMYGVGAFSAMSSLHNFRNALNNSSYYHFNGATAQDVFRMMEQGYSINFALSTVQSMYDRSLATASLNGNLGGEDGDQNDEDEAQSQGGSDNTYMAGALVVSGVLLADDASGVGVVDDLAIPFILGGAYILDRVLNPNLEGATTSRGNPTDWSFDPEINRLQNDKYYPPGSKPPKWFWPAVGAAGAYELYKNWPKPNIPQPTTPVDNTYVAPRPIYPYPYGN